MSKNRNPWFKVMPGDDARLFRDVDIETEGFIARLRRTAHDCTPYGFLVDHRQRPYDMKKIADILHLSNNRAGIAFAEARGAQLVQTAAEFLSDLQRASVASRRAKNKIAVFDAMCKEMDGIPLTEVCLMPTLVDAHLDSEANRLFGRKGGNPDLRLIETVSEDEAEDRLTTPLTTVVNHPLKAPVKPVVKAQISDVRSHSQIQKNQKEKTSTSAQEEAENVTEPVLRMQSAEAGWSWPKHLFLCDQVRKWRVKLPEGVIEDEQRYASYFWAEFGFSLEAFERAQEVYEHGPDSVPVPPACVDGLHAPDPASGRCANCGARVVDGRDTA